MKHSSFDLNRQNERMESRIVVALERISEAFRVLLWNESKQKSLSPIQIQLLIFLLFHDPAKCKISYLASEFNMTKATISDSVRVLLSKNLVLRETDPSDTRSHTLALTDTGRKIAEEACSFTTLIEKPLQKLTVEQKKVMLDGLLKLIYDLNRAGIITIQRMCFTCSHYHSDKGIHFCRLLQSRLAESEIRLDCPEHEMRS